MLPDLKIASTSIPMYGLLAALGCLLALVYLKRAEHRIPQLAADGELAMAYGAAGAFVGAKLFFLAVHLPALVEALLGPGRDAGAILQRYLYSGFLFYGGLYGCLFAVWCYCRRSRVSFFELLRLLLPVVPLVHALGRVGCFCAGCCYGRETSAACGLLFSRSKIAPRGIPLIPVQLLEAAVVFALFILLALMSRRPDSGRRMLCSYLGIYGTARFFLEFLRGDTYRGFVGVLSVSQLLSLVAIALALLGRNAAVKRSAGRSHDRFLRQASPSEEG